MKILLATNIVSPHLLPFSRSLAALVGAKNFCYVATQPVLEWRKKMGWDAHIADDFVYELYSPEFSVEKYDAWWRTADVVISCERDIIRTGKRLDQGGLTFYMSERWWRPPFYFFRLFSPAFLRMALKYRDFSRASSFHYLAIGDYAVLDMSRWANFGPRLWLWGYFTASNPRLSGSRRSKETFNVLYAGRMLRLKRVDSLIKAFSCLSREHASARLYLVGDGPELKTLKDLVARLGLKDKVTFYPSQPMEKIWEFMADSEVFVLPSSASEGWGAVVNEAMSSGCLVITSSSVGAGKTMLRNGVNGYTYKCGDWKGLGRLLIASAQDRQGTQRIALTAKEEIRSLWSPQEAARRFCELVESIKVGGSIKNGSGPLSQL